jgi:hypothetical protein
LNVASCEHSGESFGSSRTTSSACASAIWICLRKKARSDSVSVKSWPAGGVAVVMDGLTAITVEARKIPIMRTAR